MRHVAVEWRAEEGEAAGNGRLHVGPEAERAPRHLGYDGKAAIELDGVEFPAVAFHEVHDRLEHRILRMALEELVADQIVARLFGRGAAPRIDHAILGHAGSARFR